MKSHHNSQGNRGQSNYSNNSQKPQIPPKYTIRDFFPKTISNNYKNNKESKDLRKKMNPTLVLIVENKNPSNSDGALLVLNKVYESLPFEYKEEYIGKHKLLKDQVATLDDKLTAAVKEAMDFIQSLRNMLLHTPKNEEDVFKKFSFDKVNGNLFTLFKLSLRMEMIALEKHILTDAKKLSDEDVFVSKVQPLKLKEQVFKLSELINTLPLSGDKKERYTKQLDYWKEIATRINALNAKNRKDIPYIYAFASIALFADIKDVQELLTLIKLRGFTNKWILQYGIKGSYKIITPGIFKEDKNLELHRIQLGKESDIRENCANTGKRIDRNYDFFLEKGTLKPADPDKNIGYYYQKLLRYYGFSHSYPALPQYESEIRLLKAERLCKSRQEKYDNITAIRNDLNHRGLKPELPKFDRNVNTVKDSFTYIYRTDDVFMREVMGFLSDLNNIWFEQNWQIRDNTVLWQNPYDKIFFDIRRKTKPSKNALSSIYPMIYRKKEGADVASLGRNNLRSLVIAVLLNGDKAIDFEQLHATATSDVKPKTQPKQDSQEYWENLSKQCHKWKRYEQAFLVVKFIRKYISQHIHLQESIAFHQRLMNSLYIWDSGNTNLSTALQTVFTEEGLSVPKEIEVLYPAKNLKDLCSLVCIKFADAPKKESKGQTHILLKTWKSHAFTPSKGINPTIKSALKWTDNIQGDSFDIMLEYFDKNNLAYPDIVEIYLKDKSRKTLFELLQTKDKKQIQAERIVRDMLAEELLLMCIAFHYVYKIKGESSYLKLESTQTSSEKQSPTAFNIVWDIEPKLTLSLEDYNKKNVKQIVSWIFDPERISENLKKDISNSDDRSLAQKCYTEFNEAAKHIRAHNVLKSKVSALSKRFEGSKDTLDLENNFTAIMWFQKEMLNHICEIESSLIYRLRENNNLPEPGKDNYYNFTNLVINAIKSDVLLKKHRSLIGARNSLAHGKLYNRYEDNQGETYITEFKDIAKTVDEILKHLGRDDLYSYYNKVKGGNRDKTHYNKKPWSKRR